MILDSWDLETLLLHPMDRISYWVRVTITFPMEPGRFGCNKRKSLYAAFSCIFKQILKLDDELKNNSVKNGKLGASQ